MDISLGERLRLLREEKNWTQKEAADIFGITNGALSNYERDKRTPDVHTLKRIAEVYKTSIDCLLDNRQVDSATANIRENSFYGANIESFIGTDCIKLIYEIGVLDDEERKLMVLLLEGIKARKNERSFNA